MHVAKQDIQSKWMRYILLLLGFFVLTGCAASWSAKVTTFQQWPAELYQARYHIEPGPEQKNSLEFQAVADTVRVAMGAAGLVEGGPESRLVVELNYSNPVTQEWVERYVDPYDPFFYGGPFSTGIWGGFGSMRFGGIYHPMPRYVSVPINVYNNTLKVVIRDRLNNMAEVFNVTAINKDDRGELIKIMPLLAKAAFANFPGMNGTAQEVRFK